MLRALVFALLLTPAALAAADCQRASSPEPCRGGCGRFTDSDGGGVCDGWQAASASVASASPAPDCRRSAWEKLQQFRLPGLVALLLALIAPAVLKKPGRRWKSKE